MSAKDVSTGHAIDTLYLEERRYKPDPDFARQANATPDIYKQEFEEFWTEEGRERITWLQPFDKLYEWKPPYSKWYLGGRLNVCYNCVDRHVENGQGEKVAYFWEGGPARAHHVLAPAERGGALRQRAEKARRQERRPGRHLHGHGPRAAGRDAGLRAHRRAFHGRLRGLLG